MKLSHFAHKSFYSIVLVLLFSSNLGAAARIGLIGGMDTLRSEDFYYGLSATVGSRASHISLEVECYKSPFSFFWISAAAQIRLSSSNFTPYIVFGSAVRTDVPVILFYTTYPFIGVGINQYFSSRLSIRGDIRWLEYGGTPKIRIGSGIFIRI